MSNEIGDYMKYLIGLILVLSVLELRADEIRISNMTNDGELERSYVLTTNLNNKVVIDCQSFIQGLRIGEYEEAYFYMMGPEECDGLQSRISKSLDRRKHHCIEVDSEIRYDRSCN